MDDSTRANLTPHTTANTQQDLSSRSPSSSASEVQVRLVGGGDFLVNPSQRSHITDARDLVSLAHQLQTADQFTRANATNKLSVIVDQIRYLQEQARKILEEANEAQTLHNVPCNFKKIPGNMYYLYEKPPNKQRLFSMLSLKEWGKSCPYTYLGAYKLQYDMSWTPIDRLPEKEQDLALIGRILAGSHSNHHDPFAFSITDISHEHEKG